MSSLNMYPPASSTPVPTHISVITNPTKLIYKVEQEFDPTGIEVDGYFENGSVLKIDNSLLSYSPSGPLTFDDTTINVALTWGDTTISTDLEIQVVTGMFEWWSPNMTSNTAPAPYVASASSIYYAQSDAFHAFDGKTTTWWHEASSASGKQWIMFDFGGVQNIGGIRLYRRPSSNSLKDLPYSFVIQGSMDGKAFDDISTVVDAEDVIDANVPREHMFDSPVAYRYYRLYDLVGSVGYRSIAELEFYKEV